MVEQFICDALIEEIGESAAVYIGRQLGWFTEGGHYATAVSSARSKLTNSANSHT